MTARRSARLKAKADEPAPSEVSAEEPKITPKRKAPASNDDERVTKTPKTKSPTKKSDDKSNGQNSKSKAASGTKKTSNPSDQASANTSNGLFPSLPPEVMNMIIDKLGDKTSLANLGKTSKAFHALVMSQLYKRVEGSVSFHAHIAKLIRTIEPLLTIEQRKQLKKEGQYKGQQESFPDEADEKRKPEIADFVRQAVFEIGDPGQKHRFIVYRYIEEFLKSSDNLEVFAATDFTESMAKSLAAKEHLQALWLRVSTERDSVAGALTTIKGLKHLHLYMSHHHLTENALLKLIWNSRSTLRTLELDNSLFKTIYERYAEGSEGVTESSNQQHDLTALKSFTIEFAKINPEEVNALTRAIDFTALENLDLGSKHITIGLLYRHLNGIFSATKSADIKLRRLSLYLGGQALSNSTKKTAKPEAEDPGIEFISSFNTLTNLIVCNAGVHSAKLPDSGLKDTLLRGLFMHTNLTTLEFKYSLGGFGKKMPCLDTEMVTRFIDSLPNLRHLRFYPDPTKLNEIAEVLSQGRNLETIRIHIPGDSKSEEIGPEFIRHLVIPILERDSDVTTKDYCWEDHSKINQVIVDVSLWEIGSKFGKAKRGIKKAEKITAPSNPKRKVLYRDITRPTYLWLRDSIESICEWADRATKDLD